MGNGTSFILMVVYGSNEVIERRSLWAELQAFALGNRRPWTIMGDFNSILHFEEHAGRGGVEVADFIDFQECLFNSELFDARFKGEYLT